MVFRDLNPGRTEQQLSRKHKKLKSIADDIKQSRNSIQRQRVDEKVSDSYINRKSKILFKPLLEKFDEIKHNGRDIEVKADPIKQSTQDEFFDAEDSEEEDLIDLDLEQTSLPSTPEVSSKYSELSQFNKDFLFASLKRFGIYPPQNTIKKELIEMLMAAELKNGLFKLKDKRGRTRSSIPVHPGDFDPKFHRQEKSTSRGQPLNPDDLLDRYDPREEEDVIPFETNEELFGSGFGAVKKFLNKSKLRKYTLPEKYQNYLKRFRKPENKSTYADLLTRLRMNKLMIKNGNSSKVLLAQTQKLAKHINKQKFT